MAPYMGRVETSKSTFRFILNKSNAITTNVYLLLYPKGEYAKLLQDSEVLVKVWNALNNASGRTLASYGREYGGGLCKLEPNELLGIPVPEVSAILTPLRKIYAPNLFDVL